MLARLSFSRKGHAAADDEDYEDYIEESFINKYMLTNASSNNDSTYWNLKFKRTQKKLPEIFWKIGNFRNSL